MSKKVTIIIKPHIIKICIFSKSGTKEVQIKASSMTSKKSLDHQLRNDAVNMNHMYMIIYSSVDLLMQSKKLLSLKYILNCPEIFSE